MPVPPVVMWFRRDLRLADNLALTAASRVGRVVPLFIVDDTLWNAAGPPRREFLRGCLAALDRSMGGHLVVRRGDPVVELGRVVDETGAAAVYAAADFGPYGRRRDRAAAEMLDTRGVPLRWVGSPYAVEPGTVTKQDDSPFRVFTPYYRAWAAHGWSAPVPAPAVEWAPVPAGLAGRSDDAWSTAIRAERVAAGTGFAAEGAGFAAEGAGFAAEGAGFAPEGAGFAAGVGVDLLAPGEDEAIARWRRFQAEAIEDYGARRDEPGGEHTSRLSAYLKWGCIHPRTLLAGLDPRRRGHERFRSELCWREFYADVVWHQPESTRRALQPKMATMAVDSGLRADERFAAWAEGRTGYPIVDAGMRQLRAEAWMPNRVRMIVASFLVKDLHLDWRRGARYFMERLVDGDLASNTHGWQWVAGTGTDAAPYFRVFNPVTQGRKFDAAGDYVRRYVPELASLPARYIHSPWDAPAPSFDASGYPDRLVDHAVERVESLARYEANRG